MTVPAHPTPAEAIRGSLDSTRIWAPAFLLVAVAIGGITWARGGEFLRGMLVGLAPAMVLGAITCSLVVLALRKQFRCPAIHPVSLRLAACASAWSLPFSALFLLAAGLHPNAESVTPFAIVAVVSGVALVAGAASLLPSRLS